MKGHLNEHTLCMPPSVYLSHTENICYHWFRNIYIVFHNFCVVTHVTPLFILTLQVLYLSHYLLHTYMYTTLSLFFTLGRQSMKRISFGKF